jgi:uncharacterized protein YutE (UPF0331/DUF86 family)
MEIEAIKYVVFHLEGEVHEWWYHGLVTLGHARITSYLDFTQRIIEWFDKKDPDFHFKELTQLRQSGTTDAYISEFLRVAVMVKNVLEHRLIMIFIEVLSKPLCGWVKAFKLGSL